MKRFEYCPKNNIDISCSECQYHGKDCDGDDDEIKEEDDGTESK